MKKKAGERLIDGQIAHGDLTQLDGVLVQGSLGRGAVLLPAFTMSCNPSLSTLYTAKLCWAEQSLVQDLGDSGK